MLYLYYYNANVVFSYSYIVISHLYAFFRGIGQGYSKILYITDRCNKIYFKNEKFQFAAENDCEEPKNENERQKRRSW